MAEQETIGGISGEGNNSGKKKGRETLKRSDIWYRVEVTEPRGRT